MEITLTNAIFRSIMCISQTNQPGGTYGLLVSLVLENTTNAHSTLAETSDCYSSDGGEELEALSPNETKAMMNFAENANRVVQKTLSGGLETDMYVSNSDVQTDRDER